MRREGDCMDPSFASVQTRLLSRRECIVEMTLVYLLNPMYCRYEENLCMVELKCPASCCGGAGPLLAVQMDVDSFTCRLCPFWFLVSGWERHFWLFCHGHAAARYDVGHRSWYTVLAKFNSWDQVKSTNICIFCTDFASLCPDKLRTVRALPD